MTGTVGGFCRDLLDDHERGLRPGTESIAARFVEYFQISPRPDLDELTALVRRAGFGEVAEMSLEEGLKGVHFGTPGDEYHIYYRDELWQGSKEYTVLHEMYEIMHETLCELHSGTRAPTKVCREADRFAAEVLMQPEGFRALAEAWRLDVAALQREYRYAYAAVALRLAEVVRHPPLLVVLYERPGRRDPARWPAGDDLAALRAKVVKRTKGLGPPGSGLVTGRRGGIPNRDRRIPAGSLAELAARSGGAEYAEDDSLAVVARPVYWKGRLAKVIVVAVPSGERAALLPQPEKASRRRSGLSAAAAY
jgi:hypothetical protein